MKIEHIDIRCRGCERTIVIHFQAFFDIDVLASLVRTLGWVALDGRNADSSNPIQNIAILMCDECARKFLPAEDVAELDAKERAKRAHLS